MSYGGIVKACAEGKVRYDGGSRTCMPVREGIRVEELGRLVRKIMNDGAKVERSWYGLKYDGNIIMMVAVTWTVLGVESTRVGGNYGGDGA